MAGRRARIVALGAGIALAWGTGAPTAADEGPCAGVECSGHGVCMTEAQAPFCLCEEGYAAEALACLPAPVPETGRRRRSPVIGGQIVYLANKENRRGLQWVGRGQPDALSASTPAGTLWCSDFVSWVYREAGVPFTGGYDGGWHLTNNVAIQRWFTARGLWVARGTEAFARFRPEAGDYIGFDTESGNGHSGIVRYVAGDTLYTVEGNVSGRVLQRRYTHYPRRTRLRGFGILSRPDSRRPEG